MQFGLEPASKNVSRVIGSIRQIRVGITRFTVDPEHEFMESIRALNLNIKIEEVHSAKLMLENFSRIDGICYRLCALPLHTNICISISESCTESAQLSERS